MFRTNRWHCFGFVLICVKSAPFETNQRDQSFCCILNNLAFSLTLISSFLSSRFRLFVMYVFEQYVRIVEKVLASSSRKELNC